MPLTGIRIIGQPALNRHLTTAIRRMPKEVRQRLRKAVNLIVKSARPNVPVRTGKARRELRGRVRNIRTVSGLSLGGIQAVAFTAQAEIGTFKDAFWSLFLEKGVDPHGYKKRSGRHPGIRAHKFVENAVRENEAEVFALLEKSFTVL